MHSRAAGSYFIQKTTGDANNFYQERKRKFVTGICVPHSVFLLLLILQNVIYIFF